MIRNLDIALFHFINGWSGNPSLDHLADLTQRLFPLTGIFALSAYSWLWFEGTGAVRDKQRERIAAAIIATFVAIASSRILAHILPFRTRPIYDAAAGYHATSIPIFANYENWSAFPSDHAAMYFAIAVGVFLLWRAAGIFLMMYAAIWVCLPRIYLGLHYPSDILVGTIIGVTSTALCWKISVMPVYHRWIGGPAIAFEKNRPMVFYAFAVIALTEMAMMFSDVRFLASNLKFILYLNGWNIAWILFTGLFCLAILLIIIANRISGHRPESVLHNLASDARAGDREQALDIGS